MPAVPNPLLQQYMKLTEFLGHALGPDYEVALHDLTNKDRSIIAIANNHISGREIGAPLTNMALSILRDRSYETLGLLSRSITASPPTARTCAPTPCFIKQDGRLIGMLCINFDDSRYRDVSDRILGLCHPDLFVTDVLPQPGTHKAEVRRRTGPHRRNSATPPMPSAVDAINRELDRMGVVPGAAHLRGAAAGHHGAGGQRHLPSERRGEKRRRQPALLSGQRLPLPLPGQEPL